VIVNVDRDRELALVSRAADHADRAALEDERGRLSYGYLLTASGLIASALLDGADDLAGARVAFLTSPDCSYVGAQWGIWRAGGIAVPLGLSHPEPELKYVIEDAGCSALLVDDATAERVSTGWVPSALRVLDAREAQATAASALPAISADRAGMMLYTSGTSGRPKGVVSTHRNIQAQVTSLVDAWEWSPEDVILNVLPLHHIHGVINVVTCALWSGATCIMLRGFNSKEVWERLRLGGITLFMAVPTIYSHLIDAWEAEPEETRSQLSTAAGGLRLMVSGSAALPVRTLDRWREVTGHVLLERYGMTEIGMALSNPLHGTRRPGTVGGPLPGVDVRLVGDDGRPVPDGEPGEIQVRGPGVFSEYWDRPEATRDAFRDGWFCTGDVACHEDGAFRILGRRSMDIIKFAGYKLSALEIENAFREHDAVRECAVVGVPDERWGERTCIAVALRGGAEIGARALLRWAKSVLAPYKVPRTLLFVDSLPRNAMGKVIKPGVVELFGREGSERASIDSSRPR
jgi:malonyl-CoA/methylmalonyl-CoA synthetase